MNKEKLKKLIENTSNQIFDQKECYTDQKYKNILDILKYEYDMIEYFDKKKIYNILLLNINNETNLITTNVYYFTTYLFVLFIKTRFLYKNQKHILKILQITKHLIYIPKFLLGLSFIIFILPFALPFIFLYFTFLNIETALNLLILKHISLNE